MTTFSYFTCRKDPKIHWFFDSLAREVATVGFSGPAQIVVVDFHYLEPRREELLRMKYDRSGLPFKLVHVPPKPTVWQGPHRLTQCDFFAAANARNTALCLAPDGYLFCIDDLSVLLPGWLKEALISKMEGRVCAGSYEKVYNLRVRKGEILNYDRPKDEPNKGIDTRYLRLQDRETPHLIGGGELYGATMGAPTEALFKVNGWDEDCDSMGSEDYICGIMLTQNGFPPWYHPKMMSYESEEHHHGDGRMLRIIKPNVRGFIDATHAILKWAESGNRRWAPNYQNMKETRDVVLGGGEFPIIQSPQNDWRDDQLLREMDYSLKDKVPTYSQTSSIDWQHNT